MRRREFITLLGGAAGWPLAARAQQPTKMPTIGYLAALSEAADRPRRAAFVKRLSELGWTEGSNIRIDYRWADGIVSNAAAFAVEFVRSKVDVIVSNGDAYVLAVKRATETIPIVFASVGDPVGTGLVQSLARPGGNVTGLSLQLTETIGKRLELLRELVPALRRLAIAFNASDPQVHLELDAALAEAHSVGLDVVKVEIPTPRGFFARDRAAQG
jgi:putative ABC transport system substrate-binding protein